MSSTFANHIRFLRLPAMLLLPLVLSSCGGGGNSGNITGASPAAPQAVSATMPGGLTATLNENTSSIPVGGSVTYNITLTNNTAQAITFQAIGGADTTGSSIFAATIDITNGHGAGLTPGGNNSAPIVWPSTTLLPGQSVTTRLMTSSYGTVFSQSGIYLATANILVYIGPAVSSSAAIAAAQPTTVGPLAVTVQ